MTIENLHTMKKLEKNMKLDVEKSKELTGYPHIDKPWMPYYDESVNDLVIPEKTLYETFSDSALKYADMPVIDYYLKRKISYKAAKRKVDIAASAFLNMGVKKGDVVALLTANTPENFASFFALSKIGAIPAMMDLTLIGKALSEKIIEAEPVKVVATTIFLENLIEVLDETNIKPKDIILTSPFDSMPLAIKSIVKAKEVLSKHKDKDNFDEKKDIIKQIMSWKEFEKLGKQNYVDKMVPYEKDRPACIIYTSGTSGTTKGSILTDDNFNSMVLQYKNNGLEFETGDRFFNEEPPFLSYCTVLGTYLPISLGMCIAMFPDYKPEIFADRLYASKAEHVLACPADWKNFLVNPNLENRNYSFIKTPASGGSAFKEEDKVNVEKILKKYGCNNLIVEGYGMTEGSSAMCSNVPKYNVLGTAGIPLPLTNISIYDEPSNKLLKIGEEGEICFSSPTVMKGYFKNTEATKDALHLHDDGVLWLHSGDLGKVLPDGGIKVTGRKKRVILRHDGFNTSPFDIEDVINEDENVEDCCVVGKEDKEHNDGLTPTAYIVLKDIHNVDEAVDQIKNLCKKNIKLRDLPQEIVLLDELPLTKVRKVDYRLLETYEEPDSSKVYSLNMSNKGGSLNEC